ncbi:hypothetical protein PtB15_7B259 [Puccinia triticina]|nr:hypothetical protein PtB15_7B259 [Puccinia triticina]
MENHNPPSVKKPITVKSEEVMGSNGFNVPEHHRVVKPLPIRGDERENVPINSSEQVGSSRQAGLGSPSNLIRSEKANSLATFQVDDMNPLVWAWMPIITEKLYKTVANEVKEHIDPFVLNLMAACIPKHTSHQRIELYEDPQGKFSLQKQGKQFMVAMWALNCRNLETLGVQPSSGARYIEEQKKLIRSFILFMLKSREDPSTFGSQGKLVYEKTMRALHFKEDSFFYETSWENITTRPILVLERESLMMEAAVYFIGSYYKTRLAIGGIKGHTK